MACGQEQRQVNGNTGQPVSVAAAGQQVLIFQNPGGLCRIIEISMQPESNAHLQLVEGGSSQSGLPMTAIRFVQQFQLWSTPGKNVQNNVYLVIQEPNVKVDVDVRYVIGG